MSAKHTPGPWTYLYEGSGDYLIMASGKEIASVMQPQGGSGFLGGGPADENEANARLIAAAPDLLHAVRLCMQRIEKPNLSPDANVVLDAARAAIARATGEQG